MALLKTRFSQKMVIAFTAIMMVNLFLAGLLYQTTKKFDYHLQRSELAHGVLDGYLGVSNHTFRKLNAMGEIGVQGRIDNLDARFTNVQSLREEMALVRQRVAAELAFVKEETPGEELEYLSEIERLVEKIIQASSRIKAAVAAGNSEEAQRELTFLRSDEIAGRFSQLIDLALEKERRIVAETDQAAKELSRFITGVLPMVTLFIAVSMVFGVLFLSRRLTHSLSALQKGAASLSSGNLEYRIDPLAELEFRHVAKALNGMAGELASHQSELEHAKDLLEAKVIERTRELEQSNKSLARSDRNQRRLLADISHELRTPLTVIRGESEITLRGGDREAREYRETLERILQQAIHTSRLVDDLLFVARADAGTPRLSFAAVDMSALVQSVCADFRSVAMSKGVTMTITAPETPAVISADEGRLRQVLAILLDNALCYSKKEGHIHVSLTDEEKNVNLRVHDNGIGISKEASKKVFQRFYRGENAARHSEGSGLGLPVAKAITEAHGGTISLEGELGVGSEAMVILPKEQQVEVH